jgi:FimV-like protein
VEADDGSDRSVEFFQRLFVSTYAAQRTNLVKDSNNPSFKSDLALAYAAMGDRENAVKWLRELIALPEETSGRTVTIAYVYAGLGEVDEFFVFANRAFKEKTLSFSEIRLIDRVIPGTRKIGDDPRFAELFSKAGLKPEADV